MELARQEKVSLSFLKGAFKFMNSRHSLDKLDIETLVISETFLSVTFMFIPSAGRYSAEAANSVAGLDLNSLGRVAHISCALSPADLGNFSSSANLFR